MSEATEEDEDEEEAEVEAHPLPTLGNEKSSGKRLVAICFQNIIIGGVSVALVKLRFMEYVKSEVFFRVNIFFIFSIKNYIK